MKDLQREQNEMRARMKQEASATVKEKQKSTDELTPGNTHPGMNDVKKLQKRIAVLESENRELKAEIQSLRRQKIVYVEREKSTEDQRREQQHNYFKYSNARRW